MKRYFHGGNKQGPYFEGWYFKCQTQAGDAIAVIPALHIESGGQESASIQVIFGNGSWWVEFAASRFHAAEDRLQIEIGGNVFSGSGMSLNLKQEGFSLCGRVDFGPLLPLKSDIMGPFRFLADMECAHDVISMRHPVRGQLILNGAVYSFGGGTGYIETDRGRSFPSAYLWTQCLWQESSLMLSIAAIPLGRLRFTGCICAIVHHGKEYRLATYRGAGTESWSGRGAVVRQGKYRLEVTLLEDKSQPLLAPADGVMGRTVHESIHAKTRYRFWAGQTLLFDHTDCRASFETSQ